MAERKAVNKYYPPDWDPRKGSVNKRVGQHPLRDRAKKLSQGILVIRFELPYNIWCGGCGSHVGMGVRYNAEKSKVGNYYSTPIYKFRMKCHLCDNYFEIQTDPKNHDYVILSGARRKEQRWDPVANEQIVPEDKTVHKKMAMDAMYKLEHGSDDVHKGQERKQSLAELESSRLSMQDDYILNRMARDKFRTEKKKLKAEAEADQAILNRGALDIELLDETEEDRNLAGLLKYSVTSTFEDKQKEKRRSIEQRPLFVQLSSSNITATPSSSSSSTQSTSSPESKSASDSQQVKQKLGEVLKTGSNDPFSLAKSTNFSSLLCHKPSSSPASRHKSSKIQKSGKNLTLKPKSIINGLKNLAKSFIIKKKKVSSDTPDITPDSKEVPQDSKSEGSNENAFKDLSASLTQCENSSSPQPEGERLTETGGNIYGDLWSKSVEHTPSISRLPAGICADSPLGNVSSSSVTAQGPIITPQPLPSPSVSMSSTSTSALASLMESYEEGSASDDSNS